MASWFKRIFGGSDDERRQRGDKPSAERPAAEIYVKLREQALSCSRSSLGYPEPPADAPAWGLLMETGYPNGTATLISMQDGTASLYFSGGGGVIGGIGHETVRKAATAFVQSAGKLSRDLNRTENFPLPKTGRTVFYVLTDGGTLTADALEEDLGHGRHPLSALFHAGHAVITELRLVSNPSQRLARAVGMGKIAEVKALLVEGVDVNAVDDGGIPPLAIAVSGRQPESVELLLKAGADPNVSVTNEKARLHSAPLINMAATNPDTSILHMLIGAKANIEAKDATGLTPLMCAAFIGNPAAIEVLLQAGCAMEAKDSAGYTALMFASNAGHTPCVKMLLAHHANANARDNDNSTPLMFAAQHGFDECVRLLLAAGGDPIFKGRHGLSAVGFARQNGRRETEKLLLGNSRSPG
jgi:ankyrin repeat protein